MFKDCIQEYRSQVCQSPPWTLEALHSLLLQWAPTSHRASCSISPPRPCFQPWPTSNSSFKMCLILKTYESKNKAWGEGWGHFLKTEAEPSNHLLELLPLLWKARAKRIWPGTCSHHCLAAAGWNPWDAKECRLCQIIFIFLNRRELPLYWSQHITHGRELLLFVEILPLWVQDLEIDSPSKRHQKIQKCKFVHSGFVEALKF